VAQTDSELQDRVQVPVVIDSAGTAEDSQLDEHGDAANVCFAVVTEKACAGFERAAGGEEVVDEDDSAAGADGIDVDFETIRAVLEIVVGAVDLSRELARLADGDKARRERLGDGSAEDETPALGPHHQLDALAPVGVGHEFDSQGQARRVGEQGRKVLEDNPRLGMVRNISDQTTKLFQADLRGCWVPRYDCTSGGSRIAEGICVSRLVEISTQDPPMPSNRTSKNALETIEPVGARILIRKDEDKKQTKAGIHLPDKIEIPTITGRVIAVSAQVEADSDYTIKKYDRVLFNPKHAIPVDLEGDNRLFVIPVEDVVAIFRRDQDMQD